MLDRDANATITDTDPGTPMGNLFRRYWMPFLTADELPSPDCEPVRVRLMGEDLLAFKDTDGQVGLVDELCAHRRAPLWFGRNEDRGLRCVYHGWKYDVTGACVDMPAEPPESTFKNRIRLKAYPARESGGVIWAYLGPPELIPPLPDLEWRLLPDSHRYLFRYDVDSNYLQAMEGDDDSSHASFLHSTISGGIDRVPTPGQRFTDYWMKGKSPRFHIQETDTGILTGAQRPAGEGAHYWRITQWLMPFYSVIPAEAGSILFCNVRVPADNETSLYFRIVYHPNRPLTAEELYTYTAVGERFAEVLPGTHRTKENRSNNYLIDRSLQRRHSYTGIKSTQAQDMAMTDGMGAIVDRSQEHLGTSDMAIIRMRRALLRAAKQLEQGVEPFGPAHPQDYRVRSAALVLPEGVAFAEGQRVVGSTVPCRSSRT